MDFATRLLQWRQFAPEQWAKTANRYLPAAVSVLLVVALAWQAAKLTWTLIPGMPADAPPPIVSPGPAELSASATQPIDITRIMDSDLFGAVASEPVEPVAVSVLEAPETTLNLELKATVADTLKDSHGAAIIASGQEEKTYTVADVIEGSGGAQLHAIYRDRVILNRTGRLETLRLPSEYSVGAGTTVLRAPIAPMAAPTPSLRTVLSANASRLTDVVQVAAHVEQGRMMGFRLNPGREAAQFESLGFQPGDVVTEINGTAMSDPAQGLKVFEGLGESTVANVTVIRNGVPRVLTIDTSLIGELSPGR